MTALTGWAEADALAVTRAEAVSDRADGLWPWNLDGYDDISRAAQALRDDLDDYAEMAASGWDRSPSLSGLAEGIAAGITGRVRELVTVIREHCGDGAAAYVHNGSKGERAA
jgi:hypothetical protein